MARSHGVIKVGIWAPENDFRRLTKDAQRLYLLLISQPQINNCGVLPYTPERWRRFAADETPQAFEDALADLVRDRYIIVDEDTGELWVRTFIKHDKIAWQPQLLRAAWRELSEIESERIRVAIEQLYAPIFNQQVRREDNAELIVARVRAKELEVALNGALPEPLFERVAEGVTRGVARGVE